jgi:hypothetical protein
VRLKGTTLRAYASVLARSRRLDAVLAVVPADVAALLRSPPLAGKWVDWRVIAEVLVAVEGLEGTTGVRKFARETLDETMVTYRPMVAGALRLFGTSPPTVFKRLNDLLRPGLEGLEYRYQPVSDRSGIMHATYAVDGEVPSSFFVAGMAVLELALELCSARGTVGLPERHGAASASYSIIW